MRTLTTAMLVSLALPAAWAQQKAAPAQDDAGQTTAAKQLAKDTEKLWRIETSGIGG